jgi:uncharacterized protein
MQILVSGSTGLIGSAVVDALQADAHLIGRLVRSRKGTSDPEVVYNPGEGALDLVDLEGYDAVIHLAGENIFGRWTEAKKKAIHDSRVQSTSHLARALARLPSPPRHFLCASAAGYYGDRGSEELTEQSEAGDDFLAKVCRGWEEAAQPAAEAGLRVVHLRFGMVISPASGAMRMMHRAFRLGLGGRLGSGRQYMSWIALDDVAGAVKFVLEREDISGPVNVVSPHPLTNAEFTKSVARAVRRPALFPVPRFAMRLALGELADALLTSSRVKPVRLLEAGYSFAFDDAETLFRTQF